MRSLTESSELVMMRSRMLPFEWVEVSTTWKSALSKMKSQKALEADELADRLSQLISGRLKSPTRTNEFLG